MHIHIPDCYPLRGSPKKKKCTDSILNTDRILYSPLKCTIFYVNTESATLMVTAKMVNSILKECIIGRLTVYRIVVTFR